MHVFHPAFKVRPPAYRLRHWLGSDSPTSSNLAASIAKLRGGYLHHRHIRELYRPTRPVVYLRPDAEEVLLDFLKANGMYDSWLTPRETEDPAEEDRAITFESIVKGNLYPEDEWDEYDPYADELRDLDGAHTFFIIFGFDDIVGEFYEKLMDAIKLPEAAVIAVQDKVEAARVGRLVGCRRVWQPEGFTVLPVSSLHYWPQGHCSKSHKAEFLYSCFMNKGLRWRWKPMPPAIDPNGCSRGYVTVKGSLTERGFTAISFWKAYAAKGLKESKWYTKMRLREGVQKEKLVFLESQQQMLEEVDIAAKLFKDWMDPTVATALDDRDQILRKCGFPELMLPDRMPDEFRSDPLLERYRLHGGINPLVFTSLQPYWSPDS